MINLPVVKPLYKTRKAAIIVLGGVVLGCVAITAIATYNAPSDPAGAQPGSQEFVAAAKWIKDNKAEYCDMSPEQTLLQMANKTVVGKFTAQEGLQQIVQAANTYGANAEDTLRAQGLFLQALLKPKARALETAQLVNLAIEKNNPTLYAYAIQLCVDPQAAGCGNVGGKQWATMDAENGVAWLATAKDALDANDDAAATVAIETALNAKFFSARTPKLAVQN